MTRSLVPLLLLVSVAACGRPVEGPRHLLLVSLDTVRTDHLGCYGAESARTPTIDRLAREGVLFRAAISPAPSTLPAHTSIMTGSWPHTHGVPRNGFVVNEDNVLLAERLAKIGFRTAAFLGSFVLDSRFRMDQGFDHYDEDFDLLISKERQLNERSAAGVTAAVLKYVDSVDADRLFLFAHYYDAHVPYRPPTEIAERFVASGQPLESIARDVHEAARAHQAALVSDPPGAARAIDEGLSLPLLRGATGEPLGDDAWLASLYAAEVSSVDAALADLLDGLDARGLLDDMLVVITGDHGETFWEHGDFWNHGLMVYETTVHVPLIVHFPDGRFAGTEYRPPVSTIDLLPTLAEIYRFPVSRRVEGRSLLPAMAGEAFDRGPVFSEAPLPTRRFERAPGWTNQVKARCVREGDWKYVSVPYLRLEQLFDLRADPGERNDLLQDLDSTSPEILTRRDEMRERLASWAMTADPFSSSFDPSQMKETVRRLRELGYSGK